MSTFRAMWPIVDERVTWAILTRTARAELPMLAAQAKARLIGAGRFYVMPSSAVPGSGRVTETVLVFDGPAEPIPNRSYWKEVA